MKNLTLQKIVDEVKGRTDIGEIVSGRLSLDRHSMALCPFHEEKTPSFHLNVKGQYFHCFGCGIGGDVFEFLMRIEGKTFIQVLKELAERVGIQILESAHGSSDEYLMSRTIRSVLSATAEFYHKSLTSDARSYLSGRGFADDLISRFRIGYALGGLRDYLLKEKGFSFEICVKAGVLREENGKVRDYFYERIIFPNIRRGEVVHLTGRCLEKSEPKYLHLPGRMECLYNEDALLESEVLICEGVPDCLSAIQAGYHAVAAFGTNQIREEHKGKFERCEAVYICMDGDKAGRRAAERIGEILSDKAIIVDLPEGTDVNEYLQNHSVEDFRSLLNSGRPYLDTELDRLKALPENKRDSGLQKFLPKLKYLAPFKRDRYRDRVCKELKLNKKTVDDQIDRAESPKQVTAAAVSAPMEPEFSNEEKHDALELLQDPRLLERLNGTLEQLGCVGEENNKIIVFLTLTSRILDRPINLIVKGDSSAGKSFLVEAVCRLFPEDQMLIFTTVTPKALYHRKEGMAHKALVIFERPGAEESDYSIRSMQSERKLVISMSVKNPDTQQWETVDHTVEGPIAYIETTTRSRLHDENETRCFEVFIDDSEEQTKRIQQVQRNGYSGGKRLSVPDLQPWIVAQQLLKPFPVIIPFVDLIEFPEKPLRVRRDLGRFLTLIATSAILHQYQRRKVIISGVEHIEASIEDYAIAYSLASVVLQSSIKQLSPNAEKLAKVISDLVAEEKLQSFTVRQLNDRVKRDIKTVKKYLKELVALGIVDQTKAVKGEAFEYAFVRLPDMCGNLLLQPDEVEKRFLERKPSNIGKPREMAIGEVNPPSISELTEPIQLGNKKTRVKVNLQTEGCPKR